MISNSMNTKSRLFALALISTVLLAGIIPIHTAATTDSDIEFVEDSWTVDQGDEVAVELIFNNTDQGTLVFGDEDIVNYEATVTVKDANGNGTATVIFDTGSLAVDSVEDSIYAGNGTEISNASQSELDFPLDSASYDLTSKINGEEMGSSVVDVTEDESDETDGNDDENDADDSTESNPDNGQDSNNTSSDDSESDTNGSDDDDDGLPGFGVSVALTGIVLLSVGLAARNGST